MFEKQMLAVPILCYAATSINACVLGVTCSPDKPWTPVCLILTINLQTGTQLGLHPTWLAHPLCWRVSLCNLLIRVTQSSTSIHCLSWKRDRHDWERDRNCLHVCQHERLPSPKRLPIHPSSIFTFIFSECSFHSGLVFVQVYIPVTDVVAELYGAGIKLSDLFLWDWNQTIAWSLSCHLTAHSLSLGCAQHPFQTGPSPQWPQSYRSPEYNLKKKNRKKKRVSIKHRKTPWRQ